MLDDTGLKQVYSDLLNARIVISPWLAGIDIQDRFDPGVFEFLNEWAGGCAASLLSDEVRISSFNTIPIPSGFPQKALYETASSTAVSMAHEQTGTLYVGEKLARKAISRIELFIRSQGLGPLLEFYRIINLYESMNALTYYGEIPEREFLLGKWHRPWIDYSLDDELVMGVMEGFYQMSVADSHRFIALTESGLRFFKQIKKVLAESGYFKNRLSQLHVSQFNLYTNYEVIAQEIWPDASHTRSYFLDWVDIQPGMKVLELGCGSGPFTFEGGLAERVGSQGRITAIDPSAGMIKRAISKLQAQDFPWVTFIEARAEDLPFENDSFDAVLGTAFLHFTDRDKALKEMARVTRPGGTVASCHPLRLSFDKPFFREWFAPLLNKASQNDNPKNYLPLAQEVLDSFGQAGISSLITEILPFPALFHNPQKVVQHFIYGVGLFQEEMADLPHRARKELIDDLIHTGEEVCQKYSPGERIMDMPNQLIKGIAP
ncbi:MAG TPA: methyltransferase domain-containing protein [Syntrophomonadaceae bacterium]|nr:methyltransferase domain-containing protein [Syntrophomonadaceae bacterium]